MILRDAFERNTGEASAFLQRIIAIKSLSGGEEDLMKVLQGEFAPFCDSAELIAIPEDLPENALYCNVKEGIIYTNRHNLRLKVKGETDETLLLNAHADTVPATGEMLTAAEKDGCIYGRGACDDKGQIASIYLLLKTLKETGIRPQKNIEAHIVAEEETGGNGTLALMREDMRSKLAVVMEPTGLKILTGSRGAVWFKAEIKGVAGHSGEVKAVKSALKIAAALMGVLEDCHSRVFAKLKGAHPFEDFENPMPLTFGKLHAGDWPATAPGQAVLEGVFGFLPGISAAELKSEIGQCIQNADADIASSVSVRYPFGRDAIVTDRGLYCVKDFGEAVKKAGIAPVYSAFPACCDAWFYGHEKGIPVIIFGAGELKDAHSDHEKISLKDVVSCAFALYSYADRV